MAEFDDSRVHLNNRDAKTNSGERMPSLVQPRVVQPRHVRQSAYGCLKPWVFRRQMSGTFAMSISRESNRTIQNHG